MTRHDLERNDMSQISITINGRDYSIVCDDGQEQHLSRLADYLDKRVAELVDSVGQIGDARLLLMVGLLIADELADAYAEIAAARGGGDIVQPQKRAKESESAQMPDNMAAILETASRRIEAIAARLEQA
ncbi:MAG: cell division protein ZapA [Alphaproteobacteria bacterium]